MKSNRRHVIPYSELAASLLNSVSGRPMSFQGKKKRELDTISGVSDYVLHDLRRYYSSTHARLKTPIDVTEAMLDHVAGTRSQVQQIYDRYDRLVEIREAVDFYERHIRQLIVG